MHERFSPNLRELHAVPTWLFFPVHRTRRNLALSDATFVMFLYTFISSGGCVLGLKWNAMVRMLRLVILMMGLAEAIERRVRVRV